jgi:hypothetical protein
MEDETVMTEGQTDLQPHIEGNNYSYIKIILYFGMRSPVA